MWVIFLGQEDPLEEGTTTHSSIFSWKIPMDRGALWTMVHMAAKNQTRLKQLSRRTTEHTQAYVLESLYVFLFVLPQRLAYMVFCFCYMRGRNW